MKDINFDNINLFEIFTKKYNQEMKGMNHANLVIAGKTGVGKSTINQCCIQRGYCPNRYGQTCYR